MAGIIKKLAKETAIYGLSSIIGRILNWMLVPMYTRVLASTGEYGIVTNLYGWAALLLVVLTYGMETGFFRFINKSEENPDTVYSTTLASLLCSSLFFIFLVAFFLNPITNFLGYADSKELVMILAVIIAIDAFSSIPFAYLRYKNRPYRFAVLKLLFIFLNIGLNIFFLLLAPWLYKVAPASVDWFYMPDYQVGYIFVSNIIATVITLIALSPYFIKVKLRFDGILLKRMLRYSFPILILGIAGIFNQTADKIIFPFLFEDRAYADDQLGIYGACFKIAVILVMFTQAFRFAYEPFIFSRNKSKDAKETYAKAMHYFIIVALFAFLGVMLYLDILKYFVGEKYYPGLRVVPIVMLGEVFYGIYYNLSLWYKLTDQTQWGAYFSFMGCVFTVAIIVLFAPYYGFMACAWASFICNLMMMLASYFVGQKKYPIRYDLRSALFYFFVTGVLYVLGTEITFSSEIFTYIYKTFLLVLFVVAVIWRGDFPVNQIPIINKLIKR
ncbi:MAG: oligosaccharide flippase family protein [Bacteroidales bacterium]|nr:oligosaccharide flippase family protein [Bacteroidales bacterium]